MRKQAARFTRDVAVGRAARVNRRIAASDTNVHEGEKRTAAAAHDAVAARRAFTRSRESRDVEPVETRDGSG
jgi:hypothetical protein